MNGFNNEINDFVDKVKKSEVYEEYRRTLDELKKDPELYTRVEEYRKQRANMQNFSNAEELYERADLFEKENEWLKKIPAAAEFLEAELALCRMVQDICLKITEALDFE